MLLVDDDPAFAEMVADALEHQSDAMTVQTVSGGRAALDRLAEGDVDAVVSDYAMPGADGLELLDAVREEYPDLPFVLLTGKGSEDVASTAVSRGADDYIQKGTGIDLGEVLANRIANAVERRERERELGERRAKMEALHEVAVRMGECDTQQAVCDLTAEAAENILEFDICVVDVEEDELLPTKAGVGLPPGGTPTMSVEEGIAGMTYRTGESFLIDDAREVDEATPQSEYRSALSVPVGDHGVFQAGAREVGAFDEADLQLAELLVAHTAGALARVAREQAVRTERDRFAALFEMIPEPVVHVEFEAGTEESEDGKAVIKGVNSAFEATFGHAADAVVGESVNDVLVPDDRLAEAEAIDARAKAGEPINREVRRLAADGPRDFLFRSAPIDEAGDEQFGIYVDISEQKERERQLQRQNERLDEFASVVSHDLRNPLNVATGHVDLARTECDSDHLDRVARALDRMDALVADVLTMARQGRHVEQPDAVPLHEVVHAVWTTVEPAGDLRVEFDDVAILADTGRLRQVFENLFRNAAEHAGPAVTVRVGLLDDRRGFFVADDGPGIPDDERDAVFDHGHTTSDEGTGFGLSIVQSIVEAHGWTITVTESRDGGARFDVAGVEWA